MYRQQFYRLPYVYRTSGAAGRLSGYAGSCISHTAERRIPCRGRIRYRAVCRGNAEAERGRELSEEDSEEVRASSARCACVVSTRRNSRLAPSVTPVISPVRSPAAFTPVRQRPPEAVRQPRQLPVTAAAALAARPQHPAPALDQPSIHHGPCALLVAVKMRA